MDLIAILLTANNIIIEHLCKSPYMGPPPLMWTIQSENVGSFSAQIIHGKLKVW